MTDKPTVTPLTAEEEAVQAVLDARCRCGKVSASEILAALPVPTPAETGLDPTDAIDAWRRSQQEREER